MDPILTDHVPENLSTEEVLEMMLKILISKNF